MRAEYCQSGGGTRASAARVVLKFGSSVLKSARDLCAVVTEIYSNHREGRKIVAVVSAFEGETDALIGLAREAGADAQSRHAPRLIALGEEKSAALLAIACEAAGLDARVLGSRALSLRATGAIDDAEPAGVDADLLHREIERRDVVIVPGFVALGRLGEPVLLGRGGSDLTAVFLSSALGLSEAVLLKDVDGVYDCDPAAFGARARRYGEIDFATARRVAGQLLQKKAIDFGERHGVAVKVGRLNSAFATRVGKYGSPPRPEEPAAALKVAIAGLGTIGKGAALRLAGAGADYRLAAALVANAAKPRAAALSATECFEDASDLLALAPDVVVDALPSGESGRALTRAALATGISVITANKQAIAGSLRDLTALAKANGATLWWSAAVGGGAPIVETLRRARTAAPVERIEAILNGSVNFILTALAGGENFENAVALAQEAGFAEPDPRADLSGADVKAKLAILSFDAFDEEIPVAEISAEALTEERAAQMINAGGQWRQIARLRRNPGGALAASVAFERCDDDPLFSQTRHEGNAARIYVDGGRVFVARGKGAGRKPTVESLLGDLGALKRARSVDAGKAAAPAPLQESECVG